MEMLLDLWTYTICNDNRVEGADIGPVVYFRYNTGNPCTITNYHAFKLEQVYEIIYVKEGRETIINQIFNGMIGKNIFKFYYLFECGQKKVKCYNTSIKT